MVDLDNYVNVTPLFHAALIPRNYHAHVIAFKEEVLYPCNIVRKAGRVIQTSRPGMFHRADAVMEV